MTSKTNRNSTKASLVPGRILSSHERVLLLGETASAASAAGELAAALRRKLHRVDLAALASKYIGETEKNLAVLFSRAEDQNWVLFFDEADALFGRRTEVSDSHDRYANLEINDLLEQLERFKGVAIFAANAKQNIDDALLRRFQQVIRIAPVRPIPSKKTGGKKR